MKIPDKNIECSVIGCKNTEGLLSKQFPIRAATIYQVVNGVSRRIEPPKTVELHLCPQCLKACKEAGKEDKNGLR